MRLTLSSSIFLFTVELIYVAAHRLSVSIWTSPLRLVLGMNRGRQGSRSGSLVRPDLEALLRIWTSDVTGNGRARLANVDELLRWLCSSNIIGHGSATSLAGSSWFHPPVVAMAPNMVD